MTLPQYLLNRVDSSCASARLLRLRPAINIRWSAARVLAVVAAKTFLFVAVGFVLSLLIYGQVVAWPMWWLGLFALCHGIVKYGLTALCWNQRVERLKADPQMATGLPRSRFFPVRWLQCLFYFLLLSVVTPLAMWITIENVRGELAWEHFKHEWEARGEKFDVASAIPPPVPDDRNFAMTPLLRPLFEFDRGTNGTLWRDTNAYAHVDGIRVDLKSQNGQKPPPTTTLGDVAKGTFADLKSFQAFYRGNTNYPQPAVPGTAAQDVLTALGKFKPDLDELKGAADTRPDSRFPIHYEDQPCWEILLPHLSRIKALSQVLELRAVARLELGLTNEAFADLKTGFRLSDSIRDEPFIIDHLVRIASLAIDLQMLREGLVRHSWSDAQLVEVEKYLASLDVLAEYKHAMRGERCLNIGGLEYLSRNGFRNSAGTVFVGGEGGGEVAGRVLGIYKGWLYQNMLETARLHQEYLLQIVDDQRRLVFPEFADRFDKVLEGEARTPDNVLAKLLLPALSSAVAKSARAQVFVDEARIACGLERFRIAHGAYPESLAQLVPQVMAGIPQDVMNGQSLHYQRTPDGLFKLYSVGWNGTDDGGNVVLKKDGGVDVHQGDWVWH